MVGEDMKSIKDTKPCICLIGFMGSGKTTLGQALAKKLHYSWIDLDSYIEESCGKTISSLFEIGGEASFRRLETLYLKQALTQPIGVLSTGGGVIVTEENRDLLRNQETFYLKYDYDTLYNRIAGDEKRPLASTYEEVKARYIQRQVLYENTAKYQIDCEGKEIDQLVGIIQGHIKRI